METTMFIPSYQIHNILKDFTQRLRKIRQRPPAPMDPGDLMSVPERRPHDLRLTAVASKVAETIRDRIADLGEEARHSPSVASERSTRVFNAQPPVFAYYLLDRSQGKVKQHLVVEDSRILVQRFQQITTAEKARK